MRRAPLQIAAALWCVLMALLLVGVRLAGWGIPPALLAVFCAVWLFGAAMLWWFPAFGAWGTALYGVILAVALLRMHGTFSLNLGLSLAFLVGSALALASLWQRRRMAAA